MVGLPLFWRGNEGEAICVKNIRSITHSIHFFAKTNNNYA